MAVIPIIKDEKITINGDSFFFLIKKYVRVNINNIKNEIHVNKLMLKSSNNESICLTLNRFSKPILHVDESINPDTTGIVTLINNLKNFESLILFIIMAITSIIINDGKTTPKVAKTAPSNPYVL